VRALVIDDSTTMRRILGRMLRQIGFEVAEAGNGCEGLEQLRRTADTDVVLVDWNMPEMDGLAFIRAVRADSAFDSVRLMMVTTESDLSRVAMALEAGADEYVMKPFTEEIIREKLQLLGVISALTQDESGE
jgi:two-component system, chemotaxis family, chemotaxis protein CheY